jgi:hypothetical protein
MSTHIFKYEIHITDAVSCIELPVNSKICDINNQGNEIFIWCLIDIHAEWEKRYFKIIGTGHQIKTCEHLHFLKTVHMPNSLVWHIFEYKH